MRATDTRMLGSMLLAVLLVASTAPSAVADTIYLTCGADGRCQPGALFGLGFGPRLGMGWEPELPLRLEAGFTMRRLTGWEIAVDMDALWLPLRVGSWRPGVGLVVEATYGAGISVSSWDGPSPSSRPAGPFWCAAAGLTVAPLDFRLGSFDLSVLRLTAMVRRAPDRFIASLGSTLFALRVPLSGGTQ